MWQFVYLSNSNTKGGSIQPWYLNFNYQGWIDWKVLQVKDCIGTDQPTPETKRRSDHLSFSWARHGNFSQSINISKYLIFSENVVFSRLSVSESEEWVCTKTVFPNASTLRACEKTYTGSGIIIIKCTHTLCWIFHQTKRIHLRRGKVLQLFLQQFPPHTPPLPLLFRILQLCPPPLSLLWRIAVLYLSSINNSVMWIIFSRIVKYINKYICPLSFHSPLPSPYFHLDTHFKNGKLSAMNFLWIRIEWPPAPFHCC